MCRKTSWCRRTTPRHWPRSTPLWMRFGRRAFCDSAPRVADQSGLSLHPRAPAASMDAQLDFQRAGLHRICRHPWFALDILPRFEAAVARQRADGPLVMIGVEIASVAD